MIICNNPNRSSMTVNSGSSEKKRLPLPSIARIRFKIFRKKSRLKTKTRRNEDKYYGNSAYTPCRGLGAVRRSGNTSP